MFLEQSTPASVLLVLLLTSADLFGGPPQKVGKPQPMVVVEAFYPGASATVVADTVAAPIEQQVNGVANALRLESQCTTDGKYILAVTFKPGADLDQAKVLVQNRVALALPTLPDLVRRGGVSVKNKSPVRMIVSLTSPDGRYDTLFLSNYATIHVKDELARIAGVGEVNGFGAGDYALRIWLDPEKLAARKLVAGDVLKSLEQQNVRIAPAHELDSKNIVKALGRLTDPEQFGDIILKTDDNGATVRLKDVGRVEMGAASRDRFVSLNGKPGVPLGIYPIGGTTPNDLNRAVADRLATLRARLPKGLHLELSFDFTADVKAPDGQVAAEYLLLDVHLPVAASAERLREALTRCDNLESATYRRRSQSPLLRRHTSFHSRLRVRHPTPCFGGTSGVVHGNWDDHDSHECDRDSLSMGE